MKTYKHRFETVASYLHHRPPYLLIDRICCIAPDGIETESQVNGDDLYLQGHFPGAPILPGAMMQEMTTQTAGILIAAEHNPMPDYNTDEPFHNSYALGVLVKVNQARYRGFARPGDNLRIQVSLNEVISSVFQFSAQIFSGQTAIMHNAFQLTNIPSSVFAGRRARTSGDLTSY